MLDIIMEKAINGEFGRNDINKIKGMLYLNASYGEKEFKKIKKCVYDGCSNDSIKNSHTIAKSTSLREIAELNHVYHPTFVKVFPVKNDIYTMERIGIGEASVFPGFCIEHEMMFSDFEKEGEFDSVDQVLKQTYRSVCRNVAVCEKAITKHEDLLEKYFDNRSQEAYEDMRNLVNLGHVKLKSLTIKGDDIISIKLRSKLFQQKKLLEELNGFKLNMWKMLNKSEGNITIKAVNLDIVIPVAMCGFTELRKEDKCNLLFMNVIPSRNSTLVIILFKENIIGEVERYIEHGLETPLGVLNMIESMMINGTDEWYIKPSLWDSLDEGRKRDILREMFVTRRSICENTKYSIFDDTRRMLIKKMELYGVGHRIIRMEKNKLFYRGNITDAQVKAKMETMMN
jgi:hypothetical protein